MPKIAGEEWTQTCFTSETSRTVESWKIRTSQGRDQNGLKSDVVIILKYIRYMYHSCVLVMCNKEVLIPRWYELCIIHCMYTLYT